MCLCEGHCVVVVGVRISMLHAAAARCHKFGVRTEFRLYNLARSSCRWDAGKNVKNIDMTMLSAERNNNEAKGFVIEKS